MKFNINILAALFICSSLFPLKGAHAQDVVTLDSLLSLVERRNPMLREYDERVKAMNEYSKGATSWMAPMVGAGTFMRPYPNQMIMDERDKGSWMFSVEQDIPNPAKLRANRDYLRSRADVEREARAVQLNTLKAEAKANYYQWLVAEKKLGVLAESRRIMDLMLKLARLRYPYNQGSLSNIYTAEGRRNEVDNMFLMTIAGIEEKSFRLKALANLPASDSIRIDTTVHVDFDPARIPGDTAGLEGQRSDIRQLSETIEVMELNRRLQKAQAKPEFRIRFDHMQPVGDMPTQYTAMAMVSIPIAPWASKMYRSEVKGMGYEIEGMKREREAILIETRGMIAGMSKQLVRMQQQLRNYERTILPALRRNFQSVMLAYEENREQLPMVIDAWEALNMSQLEYLEKMEEYYLMIVTYEKELEK